MKLLSLYYCCFDYCLHEVELLKTGAFSFPLDLEFAEAPQQASVLLISGFLCEKNKILIQNVYEQMPPQKSVVALGNCAINRGIIQKSYVTSYRASDLVPVNVFVAGCPPSPEDILQGLKLLL